MNPWLLLGLAGLCEVVWAVAIKYSAGFSRVLPSVIAVVFMILSVWGLAMAQKTLPLGSSYAVWVGIGTVGALIVSVVFLHEPINLLKALSAALIVLGIIGLKLSHTADAG